MSATRTRHSDPGALAAVLVVVAVALVCGLSLRFHLRLDLSSDRTNSLGPVSRALVREIPEKLRISYYVSPILAQRSPGPGLVEDYLRNLAAISGGRISLDVVDPAQRPGEAEKAGMGTGKINIIEKNQSRQAVVYSGILIEYLDRSRVIPFIVDSGDLENMIARTVKALIAGSDPLLAVLVGDAGKSLDNDFSLLRKALENNLWKIAELSPGDKVPESASLLLVLGNADLGGAAAAPVRDWLSSGRNAFFAVKGVDIKAGDEVRAVRLGNTAILDLLYSCGVAVGKSLVLDRSALTVPFQGAGASGNEKVDYFLYPHWIMVRPENLDRSGGLVPESGGLDLFWPSPLESSGVPGTDFRPLIMTGKKAWLQTKDFVVAPGPESSYEAELEATVGQYTLAASAQVRIPGAAGPSRLIVVGSSDFASDLSAMTGSAFNTDFVLGAIDLLVPGSLFAATGNEDSGKSSAEVLKPRKVRDRRFSRAESAESAGRLISANYFINLFFIPAGIVIAGMIHVAGRKRMRKKPERAGKTSRPAVPAP